MKSFMPNFQKEKVVFIMGATGTGKSRLSVDLATRFSAEIINSDKMQVYKGLDIVTNKIPNLEQLGVPHHLLGEVDPNEDFTVSDFCFEAVSAVERIVNSGRVPIVVGGSNSFIQALVEDLSFKFRSKYDCCFLWLDVSLPVLHSFVSKRVDQMIDAGLVDEVRTIFAPDADYTRGIRRAIGVPEMDKYLKAEIKMDEKSKGMLLEAAIEEIKVNTFNLASCQREKIKRLRNELGWPMHHIDATPVFEKCGEEAGLAWEEMVVQQSSKIVSDFLDDDDDEENFVIAPTATIQSTSMKQSLKEMEVAH